MNTFVLVDGNSIAYRAFFALPLLHNDQGVYTNAVYGFTTMLLRILEEEKPTHFLVAFDKGKQTFRHEQFKEYKGKRDKTPSELSEQFSYIHRLLDALSISYYELENYEADDIIGTLTRTADEKKWKSKVFSGDKDLLQLVSEHTQVALTRKGISEVEAYDPQALQEKYALNAEQIIDLKGLMGDASDNIPGVPGVGEKTALKLLHQFDTVENVYAHIDEVPGKKLKEKLSANEDQALLSKKLATIKRDVPIDLSLENTQYNGYDSEKLAHFFKEMGFQSLMERIGSDEPVDEEQHVTPSFTVFDDEQDERWQEALTSPAAVHLELFEERYHRAPVVGIGICNKNGVFVIPEHLLQSETLQKWLADAGEEKWVYNFKRSYVTLYWQNIALEGVTFDPFLASYVLNPSEAGYSIEKTAQAFCSKTIPSDESIYGKGAKRRLPDDLGRVYEQIAHKVTVVYESKERVAEKVQKDDMEQLLQSLEFPLSRVLADMECHGIAVDQKQLQEMDKMLEQRLEELTNDIHELAGQSFNINSPKQLGEVLFDKLGLPVIKKTKTGYSTSADVLERLEPQHDIIGKLLTFRQLGKLKSTYVDGLLKEIDEQTGRIHTHFQQTVASTGRLSSTDPNLQNIPIRLEEGRKIRKAFVPTSSNKNIFAADYSQIELRVLAHISEDPGLIEAFSNGQDIHTKTAMDVFHVEEDGVTSLMRRQAKAVNFGIIYGISDYGLSQNLHITRKEAKQFIDRYFESYPNVKQFMETIVEQAKKDGYVSTLMHRRRYLPEINSRNFNMRSFAERTAMNTPIQGTAADIIKKAMIDMHRRLQQEKLRSTLLLQVHDELIFEVPEEEMETMKEIVPEVMAAAMDLRVPLEVDIAHGESWYDAK